MVRSTLEVRGAKRKESPIALQSEVRRLRLDVRNLQSQYGEAARPVQKVVGYDANALYLWALSQPMPVGLFTTWTPSCGDELQPTSSWRAADEWLAWVGRGLTQFRTRLDQGEKRLGPRQLPGGWLRCCPPDRLRVSRLLLARSSMLADREVVRQRGGGSRLAPVH